MKVVERLTVAAAVGFSWLNLAMFLGLLVVFARSPSLISSAGLGVGLAIAWPVKQVYRNMENVDKALWDWLESRWNQLVLTSFLLVTSSFSFVYGFSFPLSGVLNLSFQASSTLFFPVNLLYSRLAPGLGEFFFSYGRWYLQFLWLYLISGFVIDGLDKLYSRLSAGSG